MESDEFLQLATQLLASDREVRLRSAVSRAYYGAFHAARSFIENCNVSVPRHDVHDKLQWCLRNSGDERIAAVGGRLDRLRYLRNTADYDLAAVKFGNRRHVQVMVEIAIDVATKLGGWRQDPSATHARERIRAYATNILRWQASTA